MNDAQLNKNKKNCQWAYKQKMFKGYLHYKTILCYKVAVDV